MFYSEMAAFEMATSGIALTLIKSKTCKTPLGENGCLGNSYSTCWFFLIHSYSLFTHSIRLPMITYPHCSALVWLTGHHATPKVTIGNFYYTFCLCKYPALLTVQLLCDLRDAMLRQRSSGASHLSFFTVSAADLIERFLLWSFFYPYTP